MEHDKILILDFGSQVTQLIARRVREAHVYCEVHPCDVSDAWVRDHAADGRLKGVILSGSHASVYEESTDKAPQAVFDLGVPVLGICYGMQTMAHQLGGKVESGHKREFGFAAVRARGHTKLLEGIADFSTSEGRGMLNVWMSHGDKVVEMPPGFKLMASTESCPIAGMADDARGFYAVQFHPEVTHTQQGRAILDRFVLTLSGAKPDWVMRDHIAEAVESIRRQVGDEEVILGAREGGSGRCERTVPRQARGSVGSGSQAKDHRAGIRRGVQGRGREDQADALTPCRMAGPGDDLPGRHRIGWRQEQEGRHDQEPP
jgi:GMP synthase (glutamine-hydrolysing)